MNLSKRSLFVLAIAACTTLPAAAQFGSLLSAVKPGAATSGSSGNVDQDVKVFSEKSTRIEATLFNASTAIAMAYAKEEDRAKLALQRESVAKATDPKEASAKRAEAIQTAQAIAQQAASSSDLDERTKSMSDAKKQFLAKGVAQYLSGALQAKDLMPSGQALVTSVSANPMNLGKVVGVKDSLPRLGNAVAFAGESMPKLLKALQGAKVKVVEPKSSSEVVAAPSDAEFAANS